MANATTSHLIDFFGENISGGSLTFTGTANNANPTTVFDPDNSNTISSGDYVNDLSNPYSGFTVVLAGNKYAIFDTGGGNYIIPHNGELNSFSFSSPLTVVSESSATVFNCFLSGTGISTPVGERRIEDIEIGDLITTAYGRTVKVLWVAAQTHKAIAVNMTVSENAQPVRIRAGALGNGLPHSDLMVTADHGMVIDGYVINASALVNGDSINWVPMAELGDSFTVYHIETEAHDVILANGAASETFMDAAGRAAFDNHQEYLDLYGTERIIPEMPRPRINAQRLLPDAIKARLGIADGVFDMTKIA